MGHVGIRGRVSSKLPDQVAAGSEVVPTTPNRDQVRVVCEQIRKIDMKIPQTLGLLGYAVSYRRETESIFLKPLCCVVCPGLMAQARISLNLGPRFADDSGEPFCL